VFTDVLRLTLKGDACKFTGSSDKGWLLSDCNCSAIPSTRKQSELLHRLDFFADIFADIFVLGFSLARENPSFQSQLTSLNLDSVD